MVYVSVDTTQTAIERVAKNKPFLRMSLLDSSDFAVMESHDNMDAKKRVAMDEVLRDEDFVTGEVGIQWSSMRGIVIDQYVQSCYRNMLLVE